MGLAQFGCQRGDGEVERGGVDVHKIHRCAAVEGAVGAGDEGDGRGPYDVARF